VNHLSILSSKRLVYFSIKALLALLLSVVLLNSIIFFYQQDKVTKLSLFDDNMDKYTALTIGDSHSTGFHFPSLGVSGINFHDGGGDIEEVLFKSDIIFDKAKNIKQVFLPVSPGSLHLSQRVTNVNWQSRQSQIINNLPFSYKMFTSSYTSRSSMLFSILYPTFKLQNMFIKWVMLNNRFLSMDTSIDISCHIPVIINVDKIELIMGDYLMSTIKPGCIAEFADITVSLHRKLIDLSIAGDSGITNKNVDRLLLLADKLRLVDGQLVLVATPLTTEYYQDARIQKLVPEHQQLLGRLAKHPNIEVYDFHDFFYKEMSDGSNDFFYDDDHLALPGAIKFSKALKKAMDERAQIKSDK
jgi:hypothetical protein